MVFALGLMVEVDGTLATLLAMEFFRTLVDAEG